MKCKNCGAEISSDMKFCPSCGKANESVCPNCGRQIEDGGKFCIECGASIEDQSSKATSEAVANAAAAAVNEAAGNTHTINLNIVKRREPPKNEPPIPLGKAITSMIFGILSIAITWLGYGSVVGIISGIVGLVISKEPLAYKNTRAAYFASIGKTTSIIGIAYSSYITLISMLICIFYVILVFLIYCFYFMVMLGLAMPSMYY